MTRAMWIFLIALTAIRLSILPTKELAGDEAHYKMWSERLAPAYFSKGPGVAFAIRASTAVFGANEFGVRFFSPIFAAGTSLLLFYFARRLFCATAGFWAVLALNVTPLFNVGAFVMTIDPLSIFFWTAAMFTFWLALEKSPAFSFYWPITGLLVGLGFLCKYTNALEILSILLVLTFAPRLRQEFTKPGLYWLLAVFAICTLPPVIWNHQHAWVTLTHLRARSSLDDQFGIRPLEVLKFIGEHFLFYSPLLFLGLVWGVAGSWRRINQQLKVLFLFWFGVPVFVFYLLLSINKVAAPNWDALAFPSLGLLAVYFWRERFDRHVWVKRATAIALGLGLFMSVLALDSDLIRTAGFHLPRRDPSNRLRAWKTGTASLEKLRTDLEAQLGEKLFLIADDRDRASEIAFYLRDKRQEGPGHPPVYLVESQDLSNQFSFWPRYDEFVDAKANRPPGDPDIYSEEGGVNIFVGRSALFIRDGERGSLVHNVRIGFETAYPVAILETKRYGEHIRTWRIFLCRNYRTLPL
ncbi:MAG: glycosyltransferase family 39 protein [Spartobacteria bacterium]